jgi:hypothetical protein
MCWLAAYGAADPDERRAQGPQSLAEDVRTLLLEFNRHTLRRSNLQHSSTTCFTRWNGWLPQPSGRQLELISSRQRRPAQARVLGGDGHHGLPVAHALGQLHRPVTESLLSLAVASTERAPRISSMRRYGSPALVIRPRRCLPPELYCPGTSPSQAASWRPHVKSWPRPMVATRAVAVVSATPAAASAGAPPRCPWRSGGCDGRTARYARPGA